MNKLIKINPYCCYVRRELNMKISAEYMENKNNWKHFHLNTADLYKLYV